MSQEEFTITVDGKDYKVSDLENEDQQLVAHLRDLDNQLSQVNFKFEQLSASKAFFSDKLVSSLSQKNSSEASSDTAAESVAEESESAVAAE